MLRSLREGPLLCLLCVLWVSAAGAADPPLSTPLYARLALPPQGQQVLLLKLKEEGGCKARDVLFADTNFNGRFEPTERLEGAATSNRFPRVEVTECNFELFLALPTGGDVTGVNAITIQTSHVEMTDGPTQDSCAAVIRSTASHGADKWEVVFISDFSGSTRMDPPLIGATGELKLKLETKPDQEQPGNTGFAVMLSGPRLQVAELTKNGEPCTVTLKVTDEQGASVHEDTVDLTKLAFG